MFVVSVVSVMVAVAVGVQGTLLSCNYDPAAVNQHSLVAPPLEVPLPLPRSSDPRPPTPLHQKLLLQPYSPFSPDLSLPGLKPRMVHNDFVMVYQHEAPVGFFQEKHPPNYHLLESLQFVVTVSNPSEVFTVCFSEIFSDCQSITKALRRPLPLCLKPYTKYPFHFNLYITAARGRELIKAGIFFNATLLYESHQVLNRIWMREVTFNLLPNHLKLYALQLKQCRQQPSIVTLKNPTKQELELLVQYRHKKYYMNNQPFDEKVKVGSGKAFRFIIEGRDATMTIYTHNTQQPQKLYPALYLPLYCLDPLVLEPVPVGVLSAPNLVLSYPLYLTSHSSHPIQIEHISLQATSQAVELVGYSTSRIVIHANQKMRQVASMVIRSSRQPSARNSIMVQILYQSSNSSGSLRLRRTYFYSELLNALQLSDNRFYHLPSMLQSYNETEKIKHFNLSIINKFHIPVRVERVLYYKDEFKMYWYGYTGTYVYPGKTKEEFYLEYIGDREIIMSPQRHAAIIELAGGILVPFQTAVYDNTLTCHHMGREDKCSELSTIHFGYQKTHTQTQSQTVTIINLNPTNITLQLQPYSLPEPQLQLSLSIGKPSPYYPNAIEQVSSHAYIHLLAGHAINLTFQVKVNKSLVSQVLLNLETKYETIAPRLMFHFQEGELIFTRERTIIPFSDQLYKGVLCLRSTYQHNYSIREILSTSFAFSFSYDMEQHSNLQEVEIQFEYNPHQEENLTTQCCGEDFVKHRFLSRIIKGQEENEEPFEVSLVASNEVTAQTYIQVSPRKQVLLQGAGQDRELHVNVLKIKRGGTFCITVSNPYQDYLKYSILLLPQVVVKRPKDYFSYLKYARRERVQTYFCLDDKLSEVIGPNWLKEVFRLDQVPKELTLSEPKRQIKANANEYLKGQQGSNQNCYKFSAPLYFKLLIESQILNDMLTQFPPEYTRTLLSKEHIYLAEATFSAIYDDFYAMLPLNLSKYCQSSVFPIFRFCQELPLKPMLPPSVQSRRQKRHHKNDYSRVIPSQGQEESCYLISSSNLSHALSFYLTIANNHSSTDTYSVSLSFIQPLIQVGDIAFEQNHNINHATFIKHYFNELHTVLANVETLHQLGITSQQKIVPLYLIPQDYDGRFAVFKGTRYFQLDNQAAADVYFTHYGFGELENVRFFQGFSVEQVDGPKNGYLLRANSKSTFRVNFRLDHTFGFNLTNQYLQRCLTLYFYKGDHYHIQLHLAIKLSETLSSKIQVVSSSEQNPETTVAYIILNFSSFGYICLVICNLQKEEQQKMEKLKLTKEKKGYIKGSGEEKKIEEVIDDNSELELGKIKRVLLPAQGIGMKLPTYNESKWKLQTQVQEEDLKELKALTRLQHSSVISESSESEMFVPLGHEEEKEESRSSDVREEDSKQESKEDEPSLSLEQEEEDFSDHDSEGSLTESMLPDGISVCNEELDLEQEMDFEFGFEKSAQVSEKKKKGPNEEYKWFESQNPLKKEEMEPFPWMTNNNDKKKKKPKHRKHQ